MYTLWGEWMHWSYWFLSQTATADKASAFWTAIGAIGTVIAAVGAIAATWFAYGTLQAQMKQLGAQAEQSKIDLWRSMSNEFDHQLREARSRCGMAYLTHEKLEEAAYLPVLDFFETLGYLVRNAYVDNRLARHTFHYYFAAYFKATEESLRKDHKEDRKFNADVMFLDKKWGKDPVLNTHDDLRGFFASERARGISIGPFPEDS